jgi:hypothetical protein
VNLDVVAEEEEVVHGRAAAAEEIGSSGIDGGAGDRWSRERC